jgi:hypothetical protein
VTNVTTRKEVRIMSNKYKYESKHLAENALIDQIKLMKLALEAKHGPQIKKKWQSQHDQ